MKKKFVIATFILITVLLGVVSGVQANDSTLTLIVHPDQSQYPYDAYTKVTLNETMIYDNIVSQSYPSDGLVGYQIKDALGATMVIRTLSTGGTTPFNLPVAITQAYLSNTNQQQITSISIPSSTNHVMPLFYVSVYNNLGTMQSILATLNVFDSNGVPIAEASQVIPNVAAYSSGETLVNFDLPSWAHFGTAYAYVSVFNNLPSQGGVPLAMEKAFQFTITGGPAFSGTPATTNSLNYLPYKNFNMTFRLPQNPAVGTYSAYSTANYLGPQTSQTTTFLVAQLADINQDNTVNFNDITTFVGLYIAYFTNGLYSAQIDFQHTHDINFNCVLSFVGYYVLAWSS